MGIGFVARPVFAGCGRVFRGLARFGLCASLAISPGVALAATVPGAIPGSHEVSPTGAFTYTIPVAVPPGVAGIEPKLSLVYNSQSGNGLLGIGWSLSGLSVIYRCPKTYAQDGVHGGVNYDANDRYCLDGQRLVAINGAYGGNGTEYRTESESYSRVVSYGSQSSGPASWKIWTKSGQILEYGNTADSRIEAQGKNEVMLWALNRLADTVGNYLTVGYIEDNPNGQYYPDRIDYTGNATANTSPTNSVRFVYETRPDITPMYQAGSLNKTTVRLKNVQTFVGAAMGRDYRISYELSPIILKSRLIQIADCLPEESCLKPTQVTWGSIQSPPSQWQESIDYKMPMAISVDGFGDLGTRFVDLNGDGLQDFVYSRYVNGVLHATSWLNTGGGWQESIIYKIPTHIAADGLGDLGTRFEDLNGDGLPDFIYSRFYNGTVSATTWLNTGNGWQISPEYKMPTHIAAYGFGDLGTRFADLNGDGLPDFIYARAYNNTLYANSWIDTTHRDLILSLTTGLGAVTTVSYAPLTDGSVYSKDSGAVYPYVDVQAPLYVVSSVSVSDGVGGSRVTDYTYAGAKSHQRGGGFLGFRQVTARDVQSDLRSIATYRQDYPYQGQPLSSQTRTGGGTLISQTLITYTDQLLDTGKSPVWHRSLPTRTVETSYELSGGLISTVTTDTAYDAWANPTTIVVDSGGGYSKTTTHTYDNIVDPDRWFLGRLRRSTVTSVTP
ncbi:SpvB/TcaC N-terminal domain-containing protein [Comamonas sp. SCN 65-56]|uniref:SpvB/TcaC N-terminal domain-containing protein n=1 Tax=Comamonas sp. SCN 65-56 TaxID=1660095 RepID=UPI000AC4128B|nr:SpvB/TcaC N-terminal domain-containing protein [Comamonas sp. SCN 65-56]